MQLTDVKKGDTVTLTIIAQVAHINHNSTNGDDDQPWTNLQVGEYPATGQLKEVGFDTGHFALELPTEHPDVYIEVTSIVRDGEVVENLADEGRPDEITLHVSGNRTGALAQKDEVTE
jgi:hypothetical protein